MFVLWSEQEYDDKYILFIKETLDEIKDAFSDFCQQRNINAQLTEESLERIDGYSKDRDFYYSNIENVDINKKIYIFKFHEEGEGGSYHNEYYFELSNSKEELLETAGEFFVNESSETADEDIEEMLDNLSKYGQYQIPHGETYCCSLEIFEFV